MTKTTYILDDKLIASNGSRFINYIFDIVGILCLIFIVTVIATFIMALTDSNEFIQWIGNLSDLEGQIIFIVFSIIYYTLTEGFFGRSLGKFITGTVVVNENGERPSLDIILKRTLCRFIPFDAISFLGSRGWHDSISDTYVVRKKELAKEMKLFHEFNLIGNNEVV
ncbi:RDD family protein [Flavobacterium gelatinilyticum]|uniref:RDD family protein n=1 Tax=Flavobacterium gelatinilyticum TaxID=3003260 RepID=UPI002480E624|nr:RDD family protein [Flavobacterium gelatinilyticum]